MPYTRSNREKIPTDRAESPLTEISDSEISKLDVEETTSSHKILKPKERQENITVEAITCKLLWVGKMKNLLNSQ